MPVPSASGWGITQVAASVWSFQQDETIVDLQWRSSLINPYVFATALCLSLWVLVMELIFYVWYRGQLRQAQVIKDPPKVSLEDRNWLLQKMVLHAEDLGIWRQVKGWFMTQDRTATHSPHEIGRDDLEELMAWAFFYKRIEVVDDAEMAWIRSACDTIANDFHLDHSIKPGRTGVECIRHTLDAVHAIHRPLIFYLGIRFLRLLHGCLLKARGFRRGHHEDLWYWYRLPQTSDLEDSKREETVLFFHGIGMGLVLYLPLLLSMSQGRQILFELPWIAMDPFAKIPSNAEYAKWAVEVLDKHGVDNCVAVGHSFGSLPIAWLIRQFPHRIPRCVLIDPVALFLQLPDVCVNFLYKQPKNLFGKLIRVFGAREFGIARTLMRHFFWTDNVLFPEMLPAGSSVILMGEDRVIPVKEIYTSAAKLPDLRTVVINGLDHGQFLLKPSVIKEILEHINGFESCQDKQLG